MSQSIADIRVSAQQSLKAAGWGGSIASVPVPRYVVLTLAGAAAVVAAIAAASVVTGVPVPRMTQDVAAIADIHPLSGVLSSGGILLWWTSASVWALLAAVHRSGAQREEYRFAVYTAALSGYLALDDLFQVHEDLVSRLFGLEEPPIFAALAMVVVYYVVSFRSLIFRSESMLFVLALFFLMASVTLDAGHIHWLGQRLGHWMYLLEDGTKWTGIVCWCAYALRRCHQAMLASQPANC